MAKTSACAAQSDRHRSIYIRAMQSRTALHIAFDHIDDVDAGKQFLDEAFWDHAGIMPRFSRLPASP